MVVILCSVLSVCVCGGGGVGGAVCNLHCGMFSQYCVCVCVCACVWCVCVCVCVRVCMLRCDLHICVVVSAAMRVYVVWCIYIHNGILAHVIV